MVTQSNSRFAASGTLILSVHSVTMTVGFGLVAVKQKADRSRAFFNERAV